ncbi:BREX system ATP-binding domain-containing protein [Chloroflexota bacterium]
MYEKEFTQSQARQAFRYIKRGVCPPDDIEFFTVGLSRELATIRSELKSTTDGGPKSISHFLEAPYGYGKSHLLNVIKSVALKQNFGVAQITHDGYERAFNHPARYIHHLYESLLVPGCSKLGLAQIVAQLLRGDQKSNIIRWANKSSIRWGIGYYVRRMADAHDGLDTSNLKYHINCCDIQFRGGAYFHLLYERLPILSDFCRTIGLSGLVVLFDEVESIVTLLPNILSRLRSYEILHKLTDHHEFPYCCFFFAISPDFGRRIASWDYKYEYPVYKDYRPDGCRFMDSWVKNGHSIIQVPKIDEAQNTELCSKLRGLHENAYSWLAGDRVSSNFIESYIDEAEKNSLLQRDIVRSFVNILDICQQHSSCNPTQELALSVRMSISERLRDGGLEVIDNRPKGGALWVIGGLELMQILKQMQNQEGRVVFSFASRGGQATKGRPAWWTRSQG